jgi:hypothetical protein
MHTFSVDLATVKLMGWLSDAGIRSILLKGGALRQWLYGTEELRPYGDIDILVAPEQIDCAAAVMRGRGWTDTYYQSAIGHAHHMDPPPGEFPFPLDMHRSFHYVTAAPARVWELLRAHAAPIRLAGRHVETLDEVGLAVIVALHHVRHGADVKHVEDLERALARAPLDTWSRAAELAGLLGAGAAFAAGVRDVRGGGAVADALGLPGATDAALHLQLATPPQTARFLLDLREAGPHPAALLRVLAPELLPPPIRMHQHYLLARRGRIGLLFAYLLRPFWLAPRLATGWRASTAARVRAREVSGSSHSKGQRRRGRLARVRLTVEIVLTYLRVMRMLRRTDVRTVLRELRDAPLEGAQPTSAAQAHAGHLARGTARVLRHLPSDTRCLNQSLVLSALLGRRGVTSHVVIAVRDPATDFGAHAWVEVEGHVLLAPGAPGDARLAEL